MSQKRAPARKTSAVNGSLAILSSLSSRSSSGGSAVSVSSTPSMDATRMGFVFPEEPGDSDPAADVAEKQLCETLAGDLQRSYKQGSSATVDLWSPRFAFLPPQCARAPEPHLPEYELAFMGPAGDRAPCRLGRLCQGHLLATLMPGRGFTLPVYVSPAGRTYAALCILCLRLAVTVAERPHAELANLRPFCVRELEYFEGGIRFA